MFDPSAVPPISDDEIVARFIVHSSELRADGTVRPELFIPYKHVELSVQRLREATEAETWAVGRQIAIDRTNDPLGLLGRVDLRVAVCRIGPLDVVASPIIATAEKFANPNHADIRGYPPEKSQQKQLALELAAQIEGGKAIHPPTG